MRQIWRIWWPILAAITLVQIGNGLTGTLVSVTSEARAFGPVLQGLILSAFYAGSLVGALATPPLIARTSHVRSFSVFTVMLAFATAGFALVDDPHAWVGFRLVAGFGISGMFTTVESWLNLGTQDAWRARTLSTYILVQLGGLACGQFLLNARGIGDAGLFFAAASLILFAASFMRFERVKNPAFEPPRRLSLAAFAQRAPLAAGCVALSGFAWAGLMASGPALVEMIGLDDFTKSLFMAVAILSGFLAQMPVGWLADHTDRRIVLFGMTAAATLAGVIGFMSEGVPTLLVFAALFGASTFPLYAVGVARANESLEQSERTAASAAMIVYFQVGAMVAPVILSFATAEAGSKAYFAVMAAPHLAFAVAAVVALVRRSQPRAVHASPQEASRAKR